MVRGDSREILNTIKIKFAGTRTGTGTGTRTGTVVKACQASYLQCYQSI